MEDPLSEDRSRVGEAPQSIILHTAVTFKAHNDSATLFYHGHHSARKRESAEEDGPEEGNDHQQNREQ